MLESPKKSLSRLSNLAGHFAELGLIPAKVADKAYEQYSVLLLKSELKSFDIKKHRLDTFFFNVVGVGKEFPECARIMQIVFCLSHGQASVERGFSHNKNSLQNNITEKSLTSIRMVKDYMVSNKLKPHTLDISGKMLTCMKAASMKYRLDEKKEENAKVDTQKKNVQSDIMEMQAKVSALAKQITSWREEAAKLYEKTGETQDPTFCVSGNVLSSKAKEKEKEMAELEVCIQNAKKKLK